MIPQRQPPTLGYNGVTFELEFPGRFDTKRLCEGSSHYVITEALSLAQGGTRHNVEIRTRAITAPYRPSTKVVLLCGEKALAKLGYPGERLNALRGSPFLVDGTVYIPTYHPQQCADRGNFEKAFNPHAHDTNEGSEDAEDRGDDTDVKDMGRTARRNFRFWFIQDVRKAIRIAREGYHANNARYHTTLTSDGIIEKLRLTTSETPLYLDIETDPKTGRMICFGWSNSPHEIYVAPILRAGLAELNFSEPALRIIMRELALAMARAKLVVCHNALFDLFILAWRYHIPAPKQSACYDTMVAHARIHVDVEKSLGHCTSLYTQQPYHKDEGNFSPANYIQWQQLLTYNAKDVETTALVCEAQQALAARDSGLAASISQGNALVRPLLLKSLRGVYIDKDRLCGRIDELRKRALWFEENILCKLARHPLNPRSPKQVAELLYTELGLPRSSDPTVSDTGKDALYRLALKYPLPILSTILHVRKTSKEAGQLSAKLWRDSHITCAYIITGTKTFRLSSRKLLDVWGTNMQNWSKATRAIVRARPGYVLVQVDQSGAEALIVAYVAPAGRYRDLFIHKVSPHVYFGIFAFPQVWRAELGYSVEYLYPMSIAQVKADPKWPEISRCIKASDNNPPARRYYYFQKQINHSSNYDIKAQRFASNLLEKSEGQVSLPVSECDRLLTLYHQLYPEIRGGFQSYVRNQLFKHKELRNLFGYPRRFYGWVEGDANILKDAYSWIPQSTVGCITGLADSSLQARIDDGILGDISVWGNCHDSLLVECPIGTERNVGKIVCDAMNQRMVNHRGEEFAMRSEASVGEDWYAMEEMKL